MTDLAAALIDALDEAALADLADRLAPLLVPPLAPLLDRAPTVEPLLTVEQAARRAGVHVETIRRAVRDGRLPAGRAGRSLRIAPDALSAWLSGPRSAPQQPSRTSRAARQRPGRRPMADALAQLESGRSGC